MGPTESGVTQREKGPTILKPVQLLVEGPSDHSFAAFWSKKLELGQIQIQSFNGIDQFSLRLLSLRVATGFADVVRSIGIVVDADKDPASTVQKISDDLKHRQFLIEPLEHNGITTGSVVVEPTVIPLKVGLFVMPDGRRPGMLETLLMDSVEQLPELSAVANTIDQFLNTVREIPAAKERKLVNNPAKARASTYYAIQKDPNLRLDYSFSHDYFPKESAVFVPFQEFLKKLAAP